MENEINKLIEEYQLKVADENIKIEHARRAICELRKSGNDYSSIRKDQAASFARLNAYNQAISDIDSLLDYVQ